MYVAIKKIYDKRTDRVNKIHVYKYYLECYFCFKKKVDKNSDNLLHMSYGYT